MNIQTQDLTILCKPDTVLSNAIKNLDPEIRTLSEKQLCLKRRFEKDDYVIRVKFWEQVEIQRENTMKGMASLISAKDICNGVMSQQYFHDIFLKNPYRVALMLIPISSYQHDLLANDIIASQRLWEIINLPIEMDLPIKRLKTDPPLAPGELPPTRKGYNTKNAELVFKAIQEINNRIRGGTVQKSMIIQHNTNQTIQASSQQIDQKLLDDKINQLLQIKQSDPNGFQDVINAEITEPDTRDN